MLASRLCVENRACFFLCGFRLAPEVEFPTHARDGMAAIEHVHEICEKYGCDNSKLIVTGESGGGWMTITSCILLMRAEKIQKVNMMILTSPMLDHADIFTPRNEMLAWEEPMWPHRSNDFDLHYPNW